MDLQHVAERGGIGLVLRQARLLFGGRLGFMDRGHRRGCRHRAAGLLVQRHGRVGTAHGLIDLGEKVRQVLRGDVVVLLFDFLEFLFQGIEGALRHSYFRLAEHRAGGDASDPKPFHQLMISAIAMRVYLINGKTPAKGAMPTPRA